MAISPNNEQPQAVGKAHMEFAEDLEARKSSTKSDNGHIERVTLTAEEVC
jgi:hypothetical protein